MADNSLMEVVPENTVRYQDGVLHEYNGYGAHRIRLEQKHDKLGNLYVSEWHGYATVCEYENYMAFTDYFGERVVKVSDLDRKG